METLALRRVSLVSSLFLAACPATRDESPQTGGTTGGNTGGSTSIAVDSSSSGPPILDIGNPDLPTEECAGNNVDAESKILGADIILVVDNSQSMFFESTEVQNRLNDFAQAITDAGIDVKVVMLSAGAQGYYNATWVATGICIAAPLGSGICSEAPSPGGVAFDSNEPGFLHIDQAVNSYNALPVIIDQWSQWSQFFVGTAPLHIVIVSDDDSQKTAGWFLQHYQELEPDREAIVHAVVPTSMCEQAASIGQQYIDLAGLTGGVVGDLCQQDFVGVFQVLVNAVQQQSVLPCEFAIPEPPPGQVFDKNQVNVDFDDGMGNVLHIGNVAGEADCATVVDGWYYDDPDMPTSIKLCNQTCTHIQGFEGSQVQVVLGCATVPAG